MQKNRIGIQEYKALLAIFSLILIMESQLIAGNIRNLSLVLVLLTVGYIGFLLSLIFLLKPLFVFKK